VTKAAGMCGGSFFIPNTEIALVKAGRKLSGYSYKEELAIKKHKAKFLVIISGTSSKSFPWQMDLTCLHSFVSFNFFSSTSMVSADVDDSSFCGNS
jgi:hypothetical protein